MLLLEEGLRRDIFILILGYGRTGTSLCTGLLNSSPRINIGYEINNDLIHSHKEVSGGGEDLVEELIHPKHEDIELPVIYNGNKVVFNRYTQFEVFKRFYFNKSHLFNKSFLGIRVIFTERDPISSIISKRERVKHKGMNLSLDRVVLDFLYTEKILATAKSFFHNYFIFNFDKVLENPMFYSKLLFKFVGEEFKEEYITDYQGSYNYTHAKGVNLDNVLFGKKGKFPRLREEVKKEIRRKKIKIEKEK